MAASAAATARFQLKMNYETAEEGGKEARDRARARVHRLSNYMKIAGFRFVMARELPLAVKPRWSMHSGVILVNKRPGGGCQVW